MYQEYRWEEEVRIARAALNATALALLSYRLLSLQSAASSGLHELGYALVCRDQKKILTIFRYGNWLLVLKKNLPSLDWIHPLCLYECAAVVSPKIQSCLPHVRASHIHQKELRWSEQWTAFRALVNAIIFISLFPEKIRLHFHLPSANVLCGHDAEIALVRLPLSVRIQGRHQSAAPEEQSEEKQEQPGAQGSALLRTDCRRLGFLSHCRLLLALGAVRPARGVTPDMRTLGWGMH